MKLINKKITDVVFFGFSPIIDSLFEINKQHKVKSLLITSP